MLRAPQVMPHAGMSRFLMREETSLLKENTGSYVEILTENQPTYNINDFVM